MFRPFLTETTKRSSVFLCNVCTELCFVLTASRFGLPVPYLVNRPLTDAPQTSTFITKSDDPLCNSDHSALSPDTLLKYGDSELCEDEDDSPLDSSGTVFVDLFTESESSQDTENLVCGCFLPPRASNLRSRRHSL